MVALTTPPQAPTQLERIIQGIMDADVPSERKEALLRRIEREGGVVSPGLRQSLIELFEEEAGIAADRMATDRLLLDQNVHDEQASSLTQEDQPELDLLDEECQRALGNVEHRVGELQGDVRRLDHDALAAREEAKRATEKDQIAALRQGLQAGKEPPTTAA